MILIIFDYATNAACPERPSWRISEVGYEWAQIVYHSHIISHKEKNMNEEYNLIDWKFEK